MNKAQKYLFYGFLENEILKTSIGGLRGLTYLDRVKQKSERDQIYNYVCKFIAKPLSIDAQVESWPKIELSHRQAKI